MVSYSSFSCRECGCQVAGSPPPRQIGELHSSESSSSTIRCPVCVTSLLQPHLERYQRALQERDATRDNCGRELERLRQGQSTLSELQFESQRLLDRLGCLQKECSTLAVQVTAQAVENEDRQAKQDESSRLRTTKEQLERLRKSVCEGALQGAIVSATEQVRRLRFQWAMQAFVMHRLDVDYDHDANNASNNSKHSTQKPQHPALRRRQHARGIGKIGGLPLPHAGPELYGVLPPRELQSALRLVASLTCTVARCLAIVLPHPILLKPNGGVGDIIETVKIQRQKSLPQSFSKHMQQTTTAPQQHPHNINNTNKSEPVGSSSTSSLMSLMEITTTSFWGRSAKNAIARATGQTIAEDLPYHNPTTPSQTVVPTPTSPTDSPAVTSQRLLHASCAVLAEDSKSMSTSSRYALSQSVMHDEEFAIALQLLQNNVIALCIRAGVPVNNLFPAEAMLLNLQALASYCQEQVALTPW